MSGEILIRPFQEGDLEQVHDLFRRGLASLVPVMTRKIAFQPAFGAVIVLFAVVVNRVVAKATAVLLARISQSSTPSTATNLASQSGGILTMLPWIASMGAVVLPLWFTNHGIHQAFGKYIQRSIDTDLSDIPGVYQKNGGAFLVAIDSSSNKIVGMVGGENKSEEHADGVYELRRMSVDVKLQRKGIGRRLVESLEKELLPDCRQIYLTTSSVQAAAHVLYKRAGFVSAKTNPIPSSALYLVREALTIYLFKKSYG
jgi:GNAT superfamily N-acetyltransferase